MSSALSASLQNLPADPDFATSASASNGKFSSNRLSSLYPPIVSTIIGPYLSDIDACHLAQCSKQSLQQLQRRNFHSSVPVRRMLLLHHSEVSSPFSDFETRSPHAFGRASAVLFSETSEDWIYLHKLPSSVRRVVLQTNVTACLATDLLLSTPEYERKQNQELNRPVGDPYQVSASVLEVIIEGTIDTLNVPFPLRFGRIRFSNLQILRFPDNVHTVLRGSIGGMLHNLPDTLTELDLGNAKSSDLAIEGGSFWPASQQRWPANLRKLKGYPTPDARPSTKFPLPSTLTQLDSNFTGEHWSSDDLQCLFPPSLTALKLLDLHEFNAQHLNGAWIMPPAVTFLRLGKLQSSALENGGSLVLPSSTLQEMQMPYFDAVHKLLPLPESLTSLTISSEMAYSKSLVHLVNQWPRNLRSLQFGLRFNTCLAKWIPPPNLERLNLGGRGNLPLQEIPLPKTLRVLKLGPKFHRLLIGVTFPPQLEELEFGDRFKAIHAANWNAPSKLKRLTIRPDAIDATTLPSTLEKLTLLSSRPFLMEQFASRLVASILELDMGSASVRDLTPLTLANALPPHLKALKLPGRKQWSMAASAWELEVLIAAAPPASLHEVSLRINPKLRNETWILRERLMEWAKASFLPHCSLMFV